MTPWTRRLLAANFVVFALTEWFAPRLAAEMALVPGLMLDRPWTAVTYMFVHAGIWHVAFNMIVLFFFGPRLETRLGERHFLALYMVAGLAGALMSWAFIFAGLTDPARPIVGASGAVFGVLLGFARYWPRDRIFIWGVLPIEARWLVTIMAALALFGGFSGGQGGIAHFAHLGGFAGGWAYLWARDRRRGRKGPVRQILEERTRRSKPGSAQVRRWLELDPEGLHEVNRRHLERLQRKLEEEGPEALGLREREFLERMEESEAG